MFPSIPPVTRALIIANVAVFGAQVLLGDRFITTFALWPLGSAAVLGPDSGAGFYVWQLVTYAFLHGSGLHLFFNMFALYMFGGEIERLFGPRRYLAYYFVAVIVAAVTQLVVSGAAGANPYPTVGASGGVFGLLLAFGVLFPRRMIMLIFPPIPMPAWLFVTVYGVLELYLGVTGTSQGVAHFAHLGGMLGGWLMLRRWRRQAAQRGGW
ncbi:MAG TPA: rhomboid family intramembrane serine protease [Burkholderiales bacterium]|nr:rhomboid family intramembrane serine protease [Burkholderiales bacterium]